MDIAPSRRGRSDDLDEEGPPCCEASAAEGVDRALGDIEAVTPALINQPFVDRSRIAVGGQSRGGMLSVAGSGKHPEVRAVVNFVGGWMDTRTCRHGVVINRNLLNRGVTWGRPSLWLYGDKDFYYPLEDTKASFDAFLAADGKCVWHDYKPAERRVERPSDRLGSAIVDGRLGGLSRGTWPTVQAREVAAPSAGRI